MTEHRYQVEVAWSGATAGYRTYSRNHTVSADGQSIISASADPVIGRGDGSRWNPEQLFLASLSQCHMLWYLHMCTDAGIIVVNYRDIAIGSMSATRFTSVTLQPRVIIESAGREDDAAALHAKAHEMCFLANSVNFPITHKPSTSTHDPTAT